MCKPVINATFALLYAGQDICVLDYTTRVGKSLIIAIIEKDRQSKQKKGIVEETKKQRQSRDNDEGRKRGKA